MIYHHYINLPMETEFSIRIATKPKTRHLHSPSFSIPRSLFSSNFKWIITIPMSSSSSCNLHCHDWHQRKCNNQFFSLLSSPSPPHTHSIVNKHVKKREMTTIKMVLLFFSWHVSLLYVVTNKLLVMLFIAVAVVVVAVHHVHTHFHCRRC